ncbi:CBL-interacting protein kinase 23 [Porphyridium purpureum]|uniref:non-specific serine/threonine protein kinase n=1 Tax=Porphyridium purpureum TaxID=35688 RepID=A0A5J4YRY7_PORPP|nr:CBL-interacting protein kinase 23 [Porphyridium purpureum]|eukprot:POR3988..scf229_5
MGTRVGQYLLFETIGRGAFGKVKLGVHAETGEQVAVKILEKHLIKQNDLTMQVRREIAIMKALKHKNIVNLHTVLTSKTKLYIVMDLVTGGELFDVIAAKGEGGLNEEDARRFFHQLVDGVHYCHRRGVCHRDIKPENLLLAEDGEMKLTDFGLSSIKGANTDLLTTQCGTPSYVPPEVIVAAHKGYSGPKVDAWACGIMLFAMVAGYLPFDGDDISELFMNIQTVPVEYPEWVSSGAIDLMEKLLCKDPARRWDLKQVKKHPWFLADYDGDDGPTAKRLKREKAIAARVAAEKKIEAERKAAAQAALPPPQDAKVKQEPPPLVPAHSHETQSAGPDDASIASSEKAANAQHVQGTASRVDAATTGETKKAGKKPSLHDIANQLKELAPLKDDDDDLDLKPAHFPDRDEDELHSHAFAKMGSDDRERAPARPGSLQAQGNPAGRVGPMSSAQPGDRISVGGGGGPGSMRKQSFAQLARISSTNQSFRVDAKEPVDLTASLAQVVGPPAGAVGQASAGATTAPGDRATGSEGKKAAPRSLASQVSAFGGGTSVLSSRIGFGTNVGVAGSMASLGPGSSAAGGGAGGLGQIGRTTSVLSSRIGFGPVPVAGGAPAASAAQRGINRTTSSLLSSRIGFGAVSTPAGPLPVASDAGDAGAGKASMLSSRIGFGPLMAGGAAAGTTASAVGGGEMAAGVEYGVGMGMAAYESDEEEEKEEQAKLNDEQKANLLAIRRLETMIAYVKHQAASNSRTQSVNRSRGSTAPNSLRSSQRSGMMHQSVRSNMNMSSMRMSMTMKKGSVMLSSSYGGFGQMAAAGVAAAKAEEAQEAASAARAGTQNSNSTLILEPAVAAAPSGSYADDVAPHVQSQAGLSDKLPTQFEMLMALWDRGLVSGTQGQHEPSEEKSINVVGQLDIEHFEQTLSAVKYVQERIDRGDAAHAASKPDVMKLKDALEIWEAKLSLASPSVTPELSPEERRKSMDIVKQQEHKVEDDTLNTLQRVLQRWDAMLIGESAPAEIDISKVETTESSKAVSRAPDDASGGASRGDGSSRKDAGPKATKRYGAGPGGGIMQDSLYVAAERDAQGYPAESNSGAVRAAYVAGYAALDDLADDDFDLGPRKVYVNDAWKKALEPHMDSFLALGQPDEDDDEDDDDSFDDAVGEQRPMAEVFSDPALRAAGAASGASGPARTGVPVAALAPGSGGVYEIPGMKMNSLESFSRGTDRERGAGVPGAGAAAGPKADNPASGGLSQAGSLPPTDKGRRIPYTMSVIRDPARPGGAWGEYNASGGVSTDRPPMPAGPLSPPKGTSISCDAAPIRAESGVEEHEGAEGMGRNSRTISEGHSYDEGSRGKSSFDADAGDEERRPSDVGASKGGLRAASKKGSTANLSRHGSRLKSSGLMAFLGIRAGSRKPVPSNAILTSLEPEKALVEMGKLLHRDFDAEVARKKNAMELKLRVPVRDMEGSFVYAHMYFSSSSDARCCITIKKSKEGDFLPGPFIGFVEDVKDKFSKVEDMYAPI